MGFCMTTDMLRKLKPEDWANHDVQRQIETALAQREIFLRVEALEHAELVELRAKLSTQEAIVEKLHPRDGYIRRDQVLGYLATLAGLEDADPMQGTVASTVVRNTVNAFYDARDAAAEAARETEGRE